MSDAPALISEKKVSTTSVKRLLSFNTSKSCRAHFRKRFLISPSASRILLSSWRNGSLRTLSLGFCPKEGFDLIYTLAIKIIYFLNSGNCCVDSERRWHLFLQSGASQMWQQMSEDYSDTWPEEALHLSFSSSLLKSRPQRLFSFQQIHPLAGHFEHICHPSFLCHFRKTRCIHGLQGSILSMNGCQHRWKESYRHKLLDCVL